MVATSPEGRTLVIQGPSHPSPAGPRPSHPRCRRRCEEAREARTRTYYDEEADHAARDAYYAGIDPARGS